jgi:REP element-mobilizing transposase RayT
MGSTFHQMYVQAVFAVKYREACLLKSFRAEMFAVMGNLINETGCKNLIVNGIEDHVHCFFSLKPSISVSEVMKNTKAKSSKWLNESGYLPNRFEWQRGFGCFTYSKSHVDRVFRYIQNQEAHHKKETFKSEYMELLAKYEVEFDLRYLFEDLI